MGEYVLARAWVSLPRHLLTCVPLDGLVVVEAALLFFLFFFVKVTVSLCAWRPSVGGGGSRMLLMDGGIGLAAGLFEVLRMVTDVLLALPLQEHLLRSTVAVRGA